jgi:hypothetical protein
VCRFCVLMTPETSLERLRKQIALPESGVTRVDVRD